MLIGWGLATRDRLPELYHRIVVAKGSRGGEPTNFRHKRETKIIRLNATEKCEDLPHRRGVEEAAVLMKRGGLDQSYRGQKITKAFSGQIQTFVSVGFTDALPFFLLVKFEVFQSLLIVHCRLEVIYFLHDV